MCAIRHLVQVAEGTYAMLLSDEYARACQRPARRTLHSLSNKWNEKSYGE